MGITTTYKCDRCGHEKNNCEQMWGIGVQVTYPHAQGHGERYNHQAKLWCRPCMESLAILPPVDKSIKTEKPPEPLSLEELIREVMREEITAMTGAQRP